MITVLFLIIALSIFLTLALYFSLKAEKAQSLLTKRTAELNRRLYEISILKEVADRIGYSLDVEKMVDIITGSLRNLFPYSTASSLMVGDNNIRLKTYVEESVSHDFIETVKALLLASLEAVYDKPIPTDFNQTLAGVVLDDTNKNVPASFFNIPLVINGRVMGLVNIASQKPGLYKEEEMSILYRIVNQASLSISRLEGILETEKGKLLAMISSLADGVLMVDKANELQVCNPKALSMLGIAKPSPTIFDVIESLRPKLDLRTKIEEAVTKKELVVVQKLEVGNYFLQILITPVTDTGGNILGAVILLHDQTREQNLAKMKEDFTQMMVHELRAPLTAIKQAASLLLTTKTIEQEKQERFLKMIQESSDSLLIEVSDILDAAKLEAGKLSIEPTLGDISEVIKERVEFWETLAKSKNITLTAKFDSLLPEISFDKTRVAQALNNLLSNAIKFTKVGGNINVSVREIKGEIEVSVTDTGIGIPREKQEALFTKFSQLSRPTSSLKSPASAGSGPSPVPTGTGLGLYITRGIIEAHGGKISIDSQVGRGTTVTFSLPEKPNLTN